MCTYVRLLAANTGDPCRPAPQVWRRDTRPQLRAASSGGIRISRSVAWFCLDNRVVGAVLPANREGDAASRRGSQR